MSLFRQAQKVVLPSGRAVWLKPPRKTKGSPVEPLMDDATAHRFRTELAAGRWQEFHDFLEATRDWDDRHFYVTRLASLDDRPAWIAEWKAARPDSALPLLFSGAQYLHRARQARRPGPACQVEEEAWSVFQARLVDADRDLARATAMDEADPTGHACGIEAAMALRLGQNEVRRRFVEMGKRHRWHQAGNAAAIQALAPRWGGSDQGMFQFARWVDGTAPEGNGVHAVIALAHLEQWLDLSAEAAAGRDRQRTYFFAEPVKKEVRRAADRSIWSPSYQPGRLTSGDRNIFAMCFWLMHDYDAQLEQMRLIGPLIQEYPWQFQGEPGWAYERARSWALEITKREPEYLRPTP